MIMHSSGIFRYVQPAISMWQIKRLQAVLSILGIAIGVAGFVVVVAMGQGAREEFSRAVGVLGTNTVIINSTANDDSPQLSSEMLFNLQRLMGHELVAMAPVQHQYRNAYSRQRQYRARVIGTSSAYREVYSLGMARGRFLAPYDIQRRQRVAVLGQDMALTLFASTRVEGRVFRLGKDWFTVIGVLGDNALPMKKLAGFQAPDAGQSIYIPITAMSAADKDHLVFSQLMLKYVDELRIPASTPLLHRIFGAARFKQQKLELIIPFELLIKKKQFQALLELFLLGISTIILAVGVTGVLNVMLVSVNTRRNEIGLRRAVGATKNDILQQFMVEGVLLALIGGSIGLLAGWGMGWLLTSWFGLPVVFDIKTLLTALVVAVLAGVVSTIYPAIKAAKMHPVEALRV